jgi:hypothetical protein
MKHGCGMGERILFRQVVSFNVIERTGDRGGQALPPPTRLATLLDKLSDIKLKLR